MDITPSEAYELFLKNPDVFGTSAPSPADFIEAFRGLSERAKNIFTVTVSSKVSMTNNSAKIARDYAQTELPGVTIEIFDSMTATAAEGFVALAAARAAREGADMAEVAKAAAEVRDKVSLLVVMDTIRHVYRSGRIPKMASQAGAILNIRPIFTVSEVVRFIGVARSRERGIERMLKSVRNKVGENPVHVAIMHAYAQDEAERLREKVSAEFNCTELWITEFSPLMGYACGTGTVGLAFYPEI